MTYTELKAALRVFSFSEHDQLTMAQIKQRHRELSRKSHPDLQGSAASLEMQQLNAASAILMNYLQNYRFNFTEEEFFRQNPEERIRMQFSNDPVWGGS